MFSAYRARRKKDKSGGGDEWEDYGLMFKKFCDSSTVHGTYFWSSADSRMMKIIWMIIVFCGIGSAAYIINRSFIAWKTNPVITSVAQIPIEQVPFPSLTICPLGNTKFGYAERMANDRGLSNRDLGLALAQMFLLIISKRSPLSDSNCLVAFCLSKDEGNISSNSRSNCSRDLEDFKKHMGSAKSQNYSDFLRSQVVSTFPRGLQDSHPPPSRVPHQAKVGPANCNEIARDFVLLQEIGRLMSDYNVNLAVPGSILRWIYVNLDTEAEKNEMFRNFFNVSRFPELYSSSLGASEVLSLPELVEALTTASVNEGEEGDEQQHLGTLRGLRHSPELMALMRLSLHPPHVAESATTRGGEDSLKSVPNPAFPFCYYQDRQKDGLKFGPYDERYCNDFQMTMNEQGLCYTYNNFDLGSDQSFSRKEFKVDEAPPVEIRHVKGCGKSKGLQLVVDSQRWATQPFSSNSVPGSSLLSSLGFVVFVTVPGVVTHKVSFIVDPTFNGEHHFYLHGIHFIDSSNEFKDWNKDAKVCYFPEDKNLSYFSIYTQDNCLLECRYNKIMSRCGCAPFYLNQTQLPVCGVQGNVCFKNQFNNYQEDLQDRVDCDCRSDCGMIHLFASMNRYPFTDSTATDAKFWWDEEARKGRLANYLLDPLHVFAPDPFFKNVTTRLLHDNLTGPGEWASRRFQEDISILNFFFDTPIITRITLEMRVTIFDQIAAIGGSLGLFTGVSLITFVEVLYWMLKVVVVGAKRAGTGGVYPRGAGGLEEEERAGEEEGGRRVGRPQYNNKYFMHNIN